MVYRAIQLAFPGETIRRCILPNGFVIRSWSTDWRGVLAFTGAGYAWATARLVDCTPGPNAGVWWRLEGVQMLDDPLPARIGTSDVHTMGDGCLQPVMCSAWLQAQLNALNAKIGIEPTPIIAEQYSIQQSGQLAMF